MAGARPVGTQDRRTHHTHTHHTHHTHHAHARTHHTPHTGGRAPEAGTRPRQAETQGRRAPETVAQSLLWMSWKGFGGMVSLKPGGIFSCQDRQGPNCPLHSLAGARWTCVSSANGCGICWESFTSSSVRDHGSERMSVPTRTSGFVFVCDGSVSFEQIEFTASQNIRFLLASCRW